MMERQTEAQGHLEPELHFKICHRLTQSINRQSDAAIAIALESNRSVWSVIAIPGTVVHDAMATLATDVYCRDTVPSSHGPVKEWWGPNPKRIQ